MVDVRKVFAADNQMQLDMREDIHWNGIGAWLAYNQLVDTINACFWKVPKLMVSDLKFNSTFSESMDLASFLHRKSNSYDAVVSPVIENARLVEDQLMAPQHCSPSFINHWENRFINHTAKRKALIFRDSYFVHLTSLVKESFGETVLIWEKHPDTNLIRIEKPDIVIFEVVERMINDAYREIKCGQKQN